MLLWELLSERQPSLAANLRILERSGGGACIRWGQGVQRACMTEQESAKGRKALWQLPRQERGS